MWLIAPPCQRKAIGGDMHRFGCPLLDLGCLPLLRRSDPSHPRRLSTQSSGNLRHEPQRGCHSCSLLWHHCWRQAAQLSRPSYLGDGCILYEYHPPEHPPCPLHGFINARPAFIPSPCLGHIPPPLRPRCRFCQRPVFPLIS